MVTDPIMQVLLRCVVSVVQPSVLWLDMRLLVTTCGVREVALIIFVGDTHITRHRGSGC